MTTYKLKLNDRELNTLNMIEDDKVRIKLMSIYSYFIKHSQNNKLTKSMKKFHDMYKRYHDVKAFSYFKKLVYKLVEMELLTIEKNGMVNTYIIALRATTSATTSATTKKEPESVEIPNVKPVFENTEIQNPNKDTNTNTLNTISTDIVAPIEVVSIAKKFMKEAKVKSAIVKDMVIEKLRNCLNINRFGMMKYIEKVVLEKLDIYKQSRANINSAFAKKHYNNLKESAKQLQFTNYGQRTYDYDVLEKQLLGWG